MTGPSNYVREKREAAVNRRLQIVKRLKDDPKITNIKLADSLKVSRNTITQDRRAIMETLQKETLTETEQLRAAMVGKLEDLNGELERHRRDGKLPVSVVHEMLLVHRTLIEMLGIRKPVEEKVVVRRAPIQFNTTIVKTDGQKHQQGVFQIREPLTLEADHEER